jgi:CheY-like chemotaxis protein
MRPRKNVLLVDTNDVSLSLRSFVLHNWGYQPIKARGATDAIKILEVRKAYSLDLILVGDGITSRDFLRIASQADKTLQICPIYNAGSEVCGNELRAGVKSKMSRKRGPRAKAQTMLDWVEAA